MFGTAAALRADVKMPAIFGDHMVLQRNSKIPVWGWAGAGEKVKVSFEGATAKTTADANGNWKVELQPVKAAKDTGKPQSMTISGSNTVTIQDVLVGDVWICSGQSNMEFSLHRAHDAAEATPKANDPQLRLFLVTKKTALEPVSDVAGKWELCTPESAGPFSAVGYFFGRDLREKLKRPIGLIGTYWGGTPAQAWTSISGLQKEPSLSGYVEAHEKLVASFPQASADFAAKKTAFDEALKTWNEQYGKEFEAANKQWNDDAAKAKAAGQPLPPKLEFAHPKPKAPQAPDGGSGAPANLYNGMVAPLVHYAIKGVIWYQGESNAGKAMEYRTLFPAMIKDWRAKWGQGDFPFLFVQLAAYRHGNAPEWPVLRESQSKTLSLPKTGMAVAVDVGDWGDIHPKDKLDVGHRLALAALHVAYGEELVYSGPTYDSMKVEGGKVALKFKNNGGGLIIGAAPWSPSGETPAPAAELKGFVIAGEDKKFVPAEAKITGNTVEVSSPQVPNPVAVRYGWENSPVCNLYNKEQLPASPFRTDDWN